MSRSIVKKNSTRESGSKKDKRVTLSKSQLSSSTLAAVEHLEEEQTLKRGSALAFEILSRDDAEECLQAPAHDIDRKLRYLFQLDPATELKDASVLDYYVGAVCWAKTQEFDPQKLSGFFTVIYHLLNKIRDEYLSFVDCMKFVYKCLVGIGVDLPSDIETGGLEFFTVEEARAIGEYLNDTIFKHFKLFEFMFQCSQDEEIVSSDLSVEVPQPASAPFPPPLDEGISEEMINKFLTIPTPTMSAEATADLKEEEEETRKPMTPIEVELPPEAYDIFSKLTPEDIRNCVDEVTGQMLESFQYGLENKVRLQENTVLTKINKMHNVLQEPSSSEEVDDIQNS